MNLELSKQQLESAKQQATVNLTSSVVAQELVKDTNRLWEIQEEIEEARGNVEETKALLDDLEDHEITPETAKVIDDVLEDAGANIATTAPKELVEVVGVENLGYSLSPANYRLTRVAAMENLMLDFFSKTRLVVKEINALFTEALIKFTTNMKDLRLSVDYLDNVLKDLPEFKELGNISLGTRLFNTFKVDGEVKGDWVNNIKRLEATIKALSNVYIITNQNYKQTIDSYFGGFESATDIEADKRIKAIAKSINPIPFKECNLKIQNRDGYLSNGSNNLVELRSVKLPGDRFFVDSRVKSKTTVINSLEEAQDYVNNVLLVEKVTFPSNNNFIDKSVTLPALNTSVIKELVKNIYSILNSWEKTFEDIERKKLDDKEFKELRRSIFDNKELPDSFINFAITSLDRLTTHTQVEMLNIRSSLDSYLNLLIKGLIDLINLSIESNESLNEE